jgi:hypothetical protein
MAKRYVLSLCQNEASDVADLTVPGKLFNSFGASSRNARAAVTVLVTGITNCPRQTIEVNELVHIFQQIMQVGWMLVKTCFEDQCGNFIVDPSLDR